MVFGIDFDNTISTHAYPYTGKLVPYAKEVINMLHENGHHCFLWTVRGDNVVFEENALNNARSFCVDNGIAIDGYNESPIHPSSSPKQLADYFIDDINIGCPLINYCGHKVVDWIKIAEELVKLGALTPSQLQSIGIVSWNDNIRMEALSYIVGLQSDDVNDLKSVIGSSIMDEFESIGFIYVDDVTNKWEMTKLGKDYIKEFFL